MIASTLTFLSISQIATASPQSPPPSDPSCYTDVYGCQDWSNWSANWITVTGMFSETGNCWWYADYKVRYCLNDPTNVEIWIGMFGIVPPQGGANCDAARLYLYPNWPNTTPLDYNHAQLIKMKLYREAVLKEFMLSTKPICGVDPPIKYSMRFPGSCTMFCSYKLIGGDENDLIFKETPCYDTYCCGKVYSICWKDEPDPLPDHPEITEYQSGNNAGNCDLPTGNPPVGNCNPVPQFYQFLDASNCGNSCNYGSE